MDKIRLLLASEESSSRRGLTAIFASESIFEVLGAYSLKESTPKAISLQPDALLIDAGGDISQCHDEIGQIKSECPCSLVIALVDNEQSNSLVEILSLGIDGCVPRGIMRSCLVKTVELACRGGLFCLPVSFKKMVLNRAEKATPNHQIGNLPNNAECLTRRENEILELMAKNHSNREIAGKLFISEPTVKTHVSSILRKLGQSNRAQAVVYSYKMGLVNDSLVAHK